MVSGTTVSTAVWCAPLVAALMLALASGGYFIGDWGLASVVLLLVLIVSVLGMGFSLGGALGASALGGLIGLAAWQGLSSAWAYQPSAAIAAMNQTLLYGTAFALVLVGVRRTSDLARVLEVSLGCCTVVVGYALAQRLLPDIVGGDLPGRLASPISYWNALGAMAAFGALLGVAGAGSPLRARWSRVLHGALVPAFLLALLLTFSRGAFAALIVGLLVLVALAPGRIETLIAIASAAIVTLPLLATANGESTIASLDSAIAPDPGSGRTVLVALSLTTLASALAAYAGTLGVPRLSHRGRRAVGVATASVLIVVGAVVLVVRMPSEGPLTWVERQIDSFQAYDTSARTDAESISDRLAVSAGSGRWQNWEVAADQFQTSPLVGTGAGDYRFYWEAERPMDLTVRNAHSLYLEVAAETGLIGLLLVLTPIVAVGLAGLVALRRHPDGAVPRQLGIALAAGTLIAIHMAGDWTWQLPAVALLGIVSGAAVVKTAHLLRAGPEPPTRTWLRWPIAVVALGAIALVAGPLASSYALADSRRLASSGELMAALAEARRAVATDPGSPEPRLLEANLLSDLGRDDVADRAFVAAVARSPRDWATFADWSSALLRRGDAAGARAAALRAAQLNPLEPRPRYLLEAAGG